MNSVPRISCLMPTTPGRRAFVAQAIKYFRAQDYPNTELLIIDGDDAGFETVYGAVPCQSNIQYIHVDMSGAEGHLTIGAKRNLACSLAKGEIICHWDDDDWFAADRLSRQVKPLLTDDADVTGLKMALLLNVQDAILWRCSERMHAWLFPQDVRSGTLMYRASYWQNGICYQNSSNGEDVHYLQRLLAEGARLAQIIAPRSYISVRHGDNISGDIEHMDSPDWWQVPIEQYLSEEEQAFYRGVASGKKMILAPIS